jgi:hypothetical protein
MKKIRSSAGITHTDERLKTPRRIAVTLAIVAALWLVPAAVAGAAVSHPGADGTVGNTDADAIAGIIVTFIVIGAVLVAVVVSGLRHPRSERAQTAPASSNLPAGGVDQPAAAA